MSKLNKLYYSVTSIILSVVLLLLSVPNANALIASQNCVANDDYYTFSGSNPEGNVYLGSSVYVNDEVIDPLTGNSSAQIGGYASFTNAGGNVYLNQNTGEFEYAPPDNYSGIDSFYYDLAAVGGERFQEPCSRGNVNIIVDAAGYKQIEINDDSAETSNTEAVQIFPFANDTVLNGANLKTYIYSFSLVNLTPELGTFSFPNYMITNGDSITFTPNGTSSTLPARASYVVTDPFGRQVTEYVSVNITSNITTLEPYDDYFFVNENSSTALNVLENDNNSNETQLTIVNSTQPQNGTATLSESGVLSYVPNTNFYGGDNFSYSVSNGAETKSANINIWVSEVNDAPTVVFSNSTTKKSIEFDASFSSDLDGYITQYDWSFGDGTTQTTNSAIINHDYKKRGNYVVTLTVTDNLGFSNSYTSMVSNSHTK